MYLDFPIFSVLHSGTSAISKQTYQSIIHFPIPLPVVYINKTFDQILNKTERLCGLKGNYHKTNADWIWTSTQNLKVAQKVITTENLSCHSVFIPPISRPVIPTNAIQHQKNLCTLDSSPHFDQSRTNKGGTKCNDASSSKSPHNKMEAGI